MSEEQQWTEDMKPIGERLETPSFEEIDQTSEVPKTVKEQKMEQADEESKEYYKQELAKVRVEYAELSQYKALINKLEENPDVVDLLEEKLTGEIINSEDSVFGQDDEAPSNSSNQPKIVDEKSMEVQIAEAEARGAQQVEEKAKLNHFFSRLAESGVPDHLQDKFVEALRDPSGFNVEDLWAAFESRENRFSATEKNDQTVGEIPPPVAAAPGQTDKPDVDRYQPTMDGHNYIPDANALM